MYAGGSARVASRSTPLKDPVESFEARREHDVLFEQVCRRDEVLLGGGEQDVLNHALRGIIGGIGRKEAGASRPDGRRRWRVEVGELAEERLEARLFVFPVDVRAESKQDCSSV